MTLSDGPDGTVVGVEYGRHENVALLELGRGEGCAQNELQVAREEREDEDDGGGRELGEHGWCRQGRLRS